MAIERAAEFVINLGNIVQAKLDSFVNIRKRIAMNKEAEFSRRVIDEQLSYDSQIDYRKKQLEEEEKNQYPYADFIGELKTEISNLKKLARYEKLRKAYLDIYTSYKEGKTAVENLITFLEDKVGSETDPELRKEFEKELSTAKIERATSEMNVLTNRVTLAAKDKSISLIGDVIGEVEKRRNDALLIGDKETVSAMDIKLETLNSRKQELQTADKVHDFELKITQQGSTAMQRLDLLNQTIINADKTIPFFMDKVQWDSEEQYWVAQRDKYLTGMGSGVFKDFFNDLSTEISDKTKRLAAINQWGFIPLDTINSIGTQYNSLAQRPEFAGLEERIQNYKIAGMLQAVDKSAKAVIEEAETLGDYQRGEEALKNIQARFGIDTTAYMQNLYYTKITTLPAKAGAIESTAKVQVENILGRKIDWENPTTEEQKLYQQESQKLLESPFEPEPTVIKKATEKAEPAKEEPDIYAGVKAVFGPTWTPSPIFTQKGLIQKGVYGAVKIAGTPTVYTIGPGGEKIETPERYQQLFGTKEQKGIVGEISTEEAKKLGIKI